MTKWPWKQDGPQDGYGAPKTAVQRPCGMVLSGTRKKVEVQKSRVKGKLAGGWDQTPPACRTLATNYRKVLAILLVPPRDSVQHNEWMDGWNNE